MSSKVNPTLVDAFQRIRRIADPILLICSLGSLDPKYEKLRSRLQHFSNDVSFDVGQTSMDSIMFEGQSFMIEP
ncbi:MAG: hypothetical protein WCI02_09525 [Planctomycetota bacterium]